MRKQLIREICFDRRKEYFGNGSLLRQVCDKVCAAHLGARIGLCLDTFHFFDDLLVVGVPLEVSGDFWCILGAKHVLNLAVLLPFCLVVILNGIINLFKWYFDPPVREILPKRAQNLRQVLQGLICLDDIRICHDLGLA